VIQTTRMMIQDNGSLCATSATQVIRPHLLFI